jgi:hypothetical protein
LDDDLLEEVKRHAARRGMTFTAAVDQALREMLARARGGRAGRGAPVRLSTFSGKGLQPGVDLDDSATLLSMMEADSDSR